MENYLIYSVEDDEDIAYIIRATLTKQGYNVMTFSDGESFLEAFKIKKPNLILLDMMLPSIQGKEILKIIRSDHDNDDIQIIIVSANSMTIDKIDGLDLGADDYIAKPFDLLELISRVNAKARRYINSNRLIKVKDITYNLTNDYFTKGKEALNLTSFEHKLLKLLILNKNKVISKKEIAKELYDDETKENIKSIIMIIKSLRNKIDSDDNSLIKSQYGVGYVINE